MHLSRALLTEEIQGKGSGGGGHTKLSTNCSVMLIHNDDIHNLKSGIVTHIWDSEAEAEGSQIRPQSGRFCDSASPCLKIDYNLSVPLLTHHTPHKLAPRSTAESVQGQ